MVDRAVGAFLGLAVGDALGTTLEFTARDSHPLHTEMLGGGVFRLDPGVWTDDTSMALALAESIAENGRLEPKDVAARFVDWWRNGACSPTGLCFDIGSITRSALSAFERTGNPLAGPTDPDTAGNGSLMRLAPVVLPHIAAPAAAERDAAIQSRITHGAPEAVDACRVLGCILVHTIATGRMDARWPADLSPAVAALEASHRRKSRDAITSSGYAVHTLEAALWAVATTTTFEAALVAAVNLAGDADTVGAVAGQIAGARYGAAAIPARWLAPLAWRGRIESLAVRLAGDGAVTKVPAEVAADHQPGRTDP